MTIEDLAMRVEHGFKVADNNLEKLATMVNNGFIDQEKRTDDKINKLDGTMEHGFAEVSSRLTSVEKRLSRVEDILEPVRV